MNTRISVTLMVVVSQFGNPVARREGVRVALNDGSADVVLSSDQVAGLTIAAVSTSLTSDQLIALPSYADEATYHLASVGWLRKHVGWTRDSHKDEEPG